MAIKQLTPAEMAWLLLESRDTPMHVGGLFEFSPPEDAPSDYLREQFERMRASNRIPPPWNLKLVHPPVGGPALPVMREDRDIDIDYHVRHSALPYPGGQRELGILVSRLHSHQLDPHRPLWEAHLIEGLEGGRFALYVKMHHSLIDGVSGIRLALRSLTRDPERRDLQPFWTVGAGEGGDRKDGARAADREGAGLNPLGLVGEIARGVSVGASLGKAALELGRASLGGSDLTAPYTAPGSALESRLGGQRRFATQQYDLEHLRRLASEAGCTLNDVVLYLCSTALRRYLREHARLPDRSLTAGIPVDLREADDQRTGTQIGMIVAELGTNVADPADRLATIQRSTSEAKRHLGALPANARVAYALLLTAPWVTGVLAGLGENSPIPFSVTVSNVPGPREPLYFNGARLDAISPLSLLLHGGALNITCLSYAGTLNFGLTGARDTLPHLQRLAVYMGEAREQLSELLLGEPAPEPAAEAGAA